MPAQHSITRRALLLGVGSSLFARNVPRHVLAFYYGWYANPDVTGRWEHWPEGAAHQPALGKYDSHDPRIVDRHIAQAKAAGITGLIVSWWNAGDFEDQGLPLILDAAGRAGIKVSVYLETAKPRNAPTPDDTAEEVAALLERYGAHPAWLQAGSKPVLFVYTRAVNDLGLDGWASVTTLVKKRYPGGACFIGDAISRDAAKVFSGLHSYNPTSQTARMNLEQIRAWARNTYPKWVATARRRISCVTVIPGYDDTKLDRSGIRPTTSRHEGQTYRTLWEEAVQAHPDWVLITSWNEWHEGSEIEPSKDYGERELDTTREFTRNFLSGV